MKPPTWQTMRNFQLVCAGSYQHRREHVFLRQNIPIVWIILGVVAAGSSALRTRTTCDVHAGFEIWRMQMSDCCIKAAVTNTSCTWRPTIKCVKRYWWCQSSVLLAWTLSHSLKSKFVLCSLSRTMSTWSPESELGRIFSGGVDSRMDFATAVQNETNGSNVTPFFVGLVAVKDYHGVQEWSRRNRVSFTSSRTCKHHRSSKTLLRVPPGS